jgi:hypothetical protein
MVSPSNNPHRLLLLEITENYLTYRQLKKTNRS